MNETVRKPRTSKTKALRKSRLETRLTPYALKVIRRAAEIQGRSMSDFVVAAAREAAEKAIERTHIIELSLDDQRAFAEALLNPPDPGPAWYEALETHRRLIKESR